MELGGIPFIESCRWRRQLHGAFSCISPACAKAQEV